MSNKKDKTNIDNYGKLPPQNIEMEISILSTILVWNDKPYYIEYAYKLLRPDSFYKKAHQIIYKAISSLYNEDKPYDVLSVIEKLNKDNLLDDAGGPYYVTQILRDTSLIAFEHHCAFVFDCFIRREFIQLLTEKVNALYDTHIDYLDIYEELLTRLEAIFYFLDDEMTQTIQSAVTRALNEMKNITEGKSISMIKCGNKLLDNVIFTSVYDIIGIFSARSAGKTRFLISIMKGFFDMNKDIIAAQWYSFEDDDTKIMRLMAASDTGIPDQHMLGKNHTLTRDELNKVAGAMKRYESFDLDIRCQQETIENISRNFIKFIKKRDNKICFLVIDNIMLIEDIYNATGNAVQADDKVAGTIVAIKNKAKKLNKKVVIIFLHHMTKEMESRANAEEAYRPKLSHAKGSTRFVDIISGGLLINKPGMHKDLVKKHSQLSNIHCQNSDGTTMFVRRDKLLEHLMIVEVAKNRDGNVTDEKVAICRYIMDYDRMKLNELKVVK